MNIIKKITSQLSQNVLIFDILRWLLEGGYAGERTIIKKNFSMPRGRILDLGCGTGIFADMFNYENYVGVDLNEKYIERANKRYPNHCFILSDASSLPFDKEYFSDCIISGVLHHIDDSKSLQIIKEIARVLDPLGNLIIWEDTSDISKWNFLLSLIHALDEGKFIRKGFHYRQLLEDSFIVQKEYKMRSGLMEYIVFHCKKK